MKFADPKNDLAFKKIFGNENHKNILISFLNAVLGEVNQSKHIENFQILNSNQLSIIVTTIENEKLFIKFKNISKSLESNLYENMNEIDKILHDNNIGWDFCDFFVNIFSGLVG